MVMSTMFLCIMSTRSHVSWRSAPESRLSCALQCLRTLFLSSLALVIVEMCCEVLLLSCSP